MTNAAKVDDRPPLRAQQRSVADARILEGAMAVFAEKGLDGTVDDVAEAAGVGRKTVFRHFASHGELFAAVIARVMQIYEEELTGLTSMDDGRERWLENTAAALHGMNRRLLGRGFWDIHVRRPGTSPEVLAAISERYGRRREFLETLANAAWRAKGGEGRAPRWVADAFVVLLSAFATNAMESYEVEDAGESSARILLAVLSDAIGEQTTRETLPLAK
ncbi:MAG: helix-turn-helix domain-containing protein [Acidimicrobiales bacterium]|jgi:AcrR family transcriptional regulator